MNDWPEPIEDLVRWARTISIRMCRRREVLHVVEQAESEAFEALCHAVLGYDAARGPFRAYARKWITGAVSDVIKSELRRLSVEIAFDAADAEVGEDAAASAGDSAVLTADALGAAIMDALAEAYIGEELRLNGEAQLLARELLGVLQSQVEELPPRDRCLIRARYLEHHTWENVGKRLGLKDRSVRDHDLKIRKRLRKRLSEY
jgi:RNA polymerase sigma factor (sigma-70 family)